MDCAFYNADFDGDEMNCFFPKDPMTRIETMNVSHVSNFISTKNSTPQNGQVQDSNIGCALLTMNGDPKRLTGAASSWTSSTRLLCSRSRGSLPRLDPSKKIWSGKDVISVLLQKTPINFTGKPTFYNDNFIAFMDYHSSDSKTIIRNGVMLQGVLDKKSVGPKANRGVFHTIAQNYGNRTALTALYEMQQVVPAFLQYQGSPLVLVIFCCPHPRGTRSSSWSTRCCSRVAPSTTTSWRARSRLRSPRPRTSSTRKR